LACVKALTFYINLAAITAVFCLYIVIFANMMPSMGKRIVKTVVTYSGGE